MTFALTKIQPPRFRVGLIGREELEARLGAALLGQRLVLLMAPAGYGKTAALSRQLSLMPQGWATAWVTADAEDDLARFLSCLARAELRCGSPANAWQAVEPLFEHETHTGERIGVLLTGVSALTELANATWSADVPTIGVSAVRRWADTARQLRRVEVIVPAPETSEASLLLSEREIEVLQRVAEGESNKVIARTLNLSPHTVKRHLARILERLELASRGEAADWYRKRQGSQHRN